jgi:hypothetical protein
MRSSRWPKTSDRRAKVDISTRTHACTAGSGIARTTTDDERRTRYAKERDERERRLQELEDRSKRRMVEDEAALVKLYGKETFDQRRVRYAKEREAYVQAAKDRLGRTRPSYHDHDTWGGCDLCLWYEVYPEEI